MKKLLPLLIILIVAGGGGYYFYTEQVKVKSPDVVAKDTGKIELTDIKDNKKEKKSADNKTEVDYDYYDYFKSWDDLDKYEVDDNTFELEKYPDTTLYLIYAKKQDDGKIAAGFSDKKN